MLRARLFLNLIPFVVMLLAVDVEFDAVLQPKAEPEPHFAIRGDGPRHQRLDFAQPFREPRPGRCGGSDPHGRKELGLFVRLE